MIGKVIEGRYEGAHICKLPDKNLLFIETEDGERIALSKKNAISIDDITDHYPSMGRKVMMVMWNDFETSVLQFEMPPVRTSHRNTNTDSISTKEKKDNPHTSSAHTPQMSKGRYCKIHLEKCVDGVFCNTCGRNLKESEILIIGCSEDDKHSESKQSKNQMRTASDNIPSTTTVGVGTKTILLWLCIGLLLVGVFFKAKVMNTPTEEDILANRIEAFNLLHSTLTQDSDLSDAEQKKMIASYAKDAGLSYQDQDPFSKTFVDEYIATYSVHAFVEKLYTIYDDEYYRWDCTEIGNEIKCEYQMLNDMLIYALEANGIELITVALPPQGSAGFYADYPEEVPESKVFETSGKFNSGSGADIYIDTKTCTTVGSAHGDFATMREEGYSYDEGEYGWRNGVFYDTRPSWKHYDNTFYYYKGVRLGKINLSTTQYFILDNATYFLLSPESCSRGEHGRRKWLKVEVDEEALAEQVRRINIIKDAAKEEMRTFIPEVLKENGMSALYEAARKPEVWDTLTVTYQQEIMTGEQFSIDAVYSVKIGGEYIALNAQLTGNLSENSFDITAIDIDASNNASLYLDSATPELAYSTAEALLAEGKNLEAAIAFGGLGDYKDAQTRSRELWASNTAHHTVAFGYRHIIALKEDGTVIATGDNRSGQCDVSEWKDIIAVAATESASIGLKSDGTVCAIGRCNYNSNLNEVSSWTDIVAICISDGIVGIKSDGTVVTTYGIEDDKEIANWRNIVAIDTEWNHTIGLTIDGHVIGAGYSKEGQIHVSDWNSVVEIATGENYSVGLKSDGSVYATGQNRFGERDVSSWRDIVAIRADSCATFGLKSDGTVVATGNNTRGKLNVQEWADIVAIESGPFNLAGIKSDGTLIVIGENENGVCDASGWTGIKLPN